MTKPTIDHLNDPYVLQLIEALARRDDEIEDLKESRDEWERLWKKASNAVFALQDQVNKQHDN